MFSPLTLPLLSESPLPLKTKRGTMPPEIEIKILRPGDDLVLANVAPHLFDNPIDPAFAKEFLADAVVAGAF
jgi:hypothetical protein